MPSIASSLHSSDGRFDISCLLLLACTIVTGSNGWADIICALLLAVTAMTVYDVSHSLLL
jgi:hypothetical protein